MKEDYKIKDENIIKMLIFLKKQKIEQVLKELPKTDKPCNK